MSSKPAGSFTSSGRTAREGEVEVGHTPSTFYIETPRSVRQVESVALEAATLKQKPSLWTKNMFQLYACIFVGYLATCNNGYNSSVFGAVNSYKQYREYFGFDPEKGTPYTGIVFALNPIGAMGGSFFIGPLADWKGRKFGLFIGALIVVIAAILQATAHSLPQFMVGQFGIGFGGGIVGPSGIIYVAELAHPTYRGALLGCVNAHYYIGQIPATWIAWACSRIAGDRSWRIPLAIQVIFPFLVLVMCPFLPETPRWLIANNREEEALQIMTHYHGDGDPHSEIVQLEYKEMNEDISRTGSDKRWWDYRQLFNSHEARWRSFIVVSQSFITQWAGSAVNSYFYPQMLVSSGITDGNLTLLLNNIGSPFYYVLAIIGGLCADKWGRRKHFIYATAGLALVYIILTPVTATNIVTGPDGSTKARNPSHSIAIIVLIFIYGIVFAIGYTPLQVLYPVECLRYETRAKGMGMGGISGGLTGFYNRFVSGIAMSAIGWRYYFVFIFWNIAACVFLYYTLVETRGRTLEEMTEIFRSQYPVRTSMQKSKIIVQGDEIIMHEDVPDIEEEEEREGVEKGHGGFKGHDEMKY